MRTLLRQAGRGLAQRPLYTAVAILAVAAGIGASSTSFVLVDAALLSPLPFRDPQQLVTPEVISSKGFPISLSVPNYRDWSGRSQVFEASGATAGWSVVLSGKGLPRSLEVQQVLGDLLPVLGFEPQLGRLFAAAETERGAVPIAVLGAAFFDELGGDPALVGSSLVLDNIAYTVVGVLPPGVGWPDASTQAYLPLGVLPDLPWEERDSSFGLEMVGRLREGVTLASAQADLDTVTAAIRAAEGPDVATPRLLPLSDSVVGSLRSPLLLLFAAAGLVVALAVANVANLFLARAESRRGELALRRALAAPRGEALRLQLAEAAWIGLGGVLVGLALAAVLAQGLAGWIGAELPSFVAARLAMSSRAVLYSAGLGLLITLLLAALPSWVSGRRQDLSQVAGGRTVSRRQGRRFSSALVVGQLALGTLLTVGATLLAESLGRLRHVDKGFSADGVVIGRIAAPGDHFQDLSSWREFHRSVVERAQAMPGARSASLALTLPLTRRSWERRILPAETPYDPREGDSVNMNIVSPGHFSTLGIPLLRGRLFEAGDRDGTELVAVVDETLAERFWPGQDPIGRRVTFETDRNAPAGEIRPLYRTVVGVVKNVRHYELQSPSRIQVYLPVDQTAGRFGFDLSLAVRTDGATEPLLRQLPEVVAAVDSAVPMRQLGNLESVVEASLLRPRVLALVARALSLIALVLAAVGVFAVCSYGVAARRQELGLRGALGASPKRLLAEVLTQALAWNGLGLLLGLAGAALAARAAAALLWGVGALELGPYLTGALVLSGLSLTAALAPALQAMRIEPATVLRQPG